MSIDICKLFEFSWAIKEVVADALGLEVLEISIHTKLPGSLDFQKLASLILVSKIRFKPLPSDRVVTLGDFFESCIFEKEKSFSEFPPL